MPLPTNEGPAVSRESNTIATVASGGFAVNPAAELERVFSDIHQQQMRELSIINPLIRVEAVGFSEWEGHWLGILITPWFMNLLVLPKQGSSWPQFDSGKRKGEAITLSFPRGAYPFFAREEAGVGSYLSCSLASPVQEWRSHAELRKTAQEVLLMLRTLAVTQLDEAADKPLDNQGCQLSRRNFLGGGEPARRC